MKTNVQELAKAVASLSADEIEKNFPFSFALHQELSKKEQKQPPVVAGVDANGPK